MQDITQWFKQSCAALPSGEMIKPGDLTMLDAMNALQLMDPKMDTGVHKASSSRFVFDPAAHMLPQDICWVMDEMLALEVAWYGGATLCQSVYTSLHYHNPHLLVGTSDLSNTDGNTLLIRLVLRAYVLLYCKTIDLVYTELAKGHVHDGEDCWLDHYGVAVRMSDPVVDIVYLADDALGWLESDECQNSIDLPPERTDTAAACFDPEMPAYLRQSMPLPTYQSLSPREGWKTVKTLVRDLIKLEHLQRSGSFTEWETKFLAVCEGKLQADPRIDNFTEQLTYEECGLVAAQTVDETVEAGVARQITLWRALIQGFLLSTVTASILNRPRQRRALLSMSATWRERAAMGQYFSTHTDLQPICQVLHALRFDCLLESALAAFDMGLVIPGDERESWWWIASVASNRVATCPSKTWRTFWAKTWASIGAAMQLHAQKSLYLPNGSKVRSGLVPEYQAWIRDQHALDCRQGSAAAADWDFVVGPGFCEFD
ncbi:hypothetical protein IAR55_005007 [Kwoniella newhampshirensis]|uniref:NAA35-like N-terminal domain-containing protein n=1 Tax=Kwoniella newhampshirensis TaxID=1651941 RepID=A0AAW0YIK1_9TREE